MSRAMHGPRSLSAVPCDETVVEELTVDSVDSAEPNPKLTVLTGEDAGHSVVVSDPTLLGRDDNCGLRVRGPNVSRRHAVLSRSETGQWKVTDLKSSNGTRVNGDLIEEHLLNYGDRIS